MTDVHDRPPHSMDRPTPTAPPTRRYAYETDGRAIYRESFATIRREMDLSHLPPSLHTAAVRIAHSAGDVGIVSEISGDATISDVVRRALVSEAPVITDSHMLASGITASRLPADNDVLCFLRDPRAAELALAWNTTRSAAAVSLWEPHLEGAVVAIGNAPTALFHLLELILDGGPRPAAIIGIPVGFIGSTESKRALADHRLPDGTQVPWLTVHGRRGGSAMAAGAVNALSTPQEIL